MTPNQNKTVHALFHSTGLMAHKATIVGGISFGRTESTKELTHEEVQMLIEYLQKEKGDTEAAQRMRRKIISYCHQLHWYKPNTQQVDMERLNNWCQKYGYLHKKLNAYTNKELPKLVSQFKEVFADVLSKI